MQDKTVTRGFHGFWHLASAGRMEPTLLAKRPTQCPYLSHSTNATARSQKLSGSLNLRCTTPASRKRHLC